MRSFNGSDPAVRAGFSYCRWLTGSAGSHFSLSFLLLPPERRQAMEAVYAYCRAMDDVVDREGVDPAEARAELVRWRSELAACGAGFPTHPIAVALERVSRRHGVPLEYFGRLIDGMEMDLDRRRYASFDELRLYCERVASVVGLISVRVFGCAGPAADDYAVSLGIALQLTNILRDLKADGAQGRVYLPQEDLSRFGVTEADLVNLAVRAEPVEARRSSFDKSRMNGEISDAFRQLMVFECGRARGYFEQAAEACRRSGEGRKLLPARIMGRVYREILAEIERSPGAVFTRKVSVPRGRQAWAAARCLVTSS